MQQLGRGIRKHKDKKYLNVLDFIGNYNKADRLLNPFNDYLGFLKENGELFESEEALFCSRGHDFIKMIETTSMIKSYKIPIFLAFYNGGKVKMEIDEEDV